MTPDLTHVTAPGSVCVFCNKLLPTIHLDHPDEFAYCTACEPALTRLLSRDRREL